MFDNNKKIDFGWQFLRYYSVARLVIALLLFLLPFIAKSQGGLYDQDVYTTAAISYVILASLLLFLSFVEHQFHIQAYSQPFTDILMLSLLAYAGQSDSAGYIVLMALVAIFALLLVRNRLGMLYGILVSIGLVLVYRIREGEFDQTFYSEVSLQIAGILVVTLLGNILARRLTYYEEETAEQQRSIAHMHRLNSQIIEKMNRGIIVVDDQNRIRHINQTAWYGLGLPDTPIGKPLAAITDDLDYQLKRANRTSHEGLPFRATSTGPQLLPRFIPLNTNDMTLILLDNYSDVIKKAQQLKLASLGQLTASIAHEIRNPLSAINQSIQMLLESVSENPQEQQLMEIIERQSKRINEIIDNIQKVSKRKPPERQILVMDRFLPSFIKEYQQGLQEPATITTEGVESGLKVAFDQSQLKQVLSNLFDNALKYSHLNTNQYQLHLAAGRDPLSGDLFLDVIDEGVGVSMEEKDKIFEPFYTTHHSGTGLGLYISKELCEANQARLDCIPVAFGGACFRISFDTSSFMIDAELAEQLAEIESEDAGNLGNSTPKEDRRR
ncbi:two-component sensor histidine kinase [Kangiella profundi]|uniref:histidine kinase n=1 Tax=Kangiella profundi TaxID=1561924 RepID=A0A2K9AB64_9GAMM|nr:ATP-binding protein [Kangiella profundi]AUD78667.1 two-component sensor histidine kinase [Kangiella profundi]GGF09956.1 sensor protein PilS [Kangiella profundi]